MIQSGGKNKTFAQMWIDEPNKARFKLTPKEVRKLLGKESYDRIYGHFCEMGSHPTFVSAQTMSYKEVRRDGSSGIVVQIGSTDIVYPILFSLAFAYLLMLTSSISLTKHLGKDSKENITFLLEQLNYFEKFMSECSQPAFKKYGEKLETGMEPIIEDLKVLKEKLGNPK